MKNRMNIVALAALALALISCKNGGNSDNSNPAIKAALMTALPFNQTQCPILNGYYNRLGSNGLPLAIGRIVNMGPVQGKPGLILSDNELQDGGEIHWLIDGQVHLQKVSDGTIAYVGGCDKNQLHLRIQTEGVNEFWYAPMPSGFKVTSTTGFSDPKDIALYQLTQPLKNSSAEPEEGDNGKQPVGENKPPAPKS